MKFLLLLLVLTFSVKLYASEEELLGVMKREVQSLRDEFMQKYEDLRSKVTSTRKRRDICELCQGNRGDDGLDGIDGVPGQKGSRLMMSVFDIVVHLFFWSPDQGVWGCFLRHRL